MRAATSAFTFLTALAALLMVAPLANAATDDVDRNPPQRPMDDGFGDHRESDRPAAEALLTVSLPERPLALNPSAPSIDPDALVTPDTPVDTSDVIRRDHGPHEPTTIEEPEAHLATPIDDPNPPSVRTLLADLMNDLRHLLR